MTNEHFVLPKTYLVGCTSLNIEGMGDYLRDTGQEEFVMALREARQEGLSDGEMLCSFYAKLCYASLVVGKNENISRVRGIYSNILGTIESGHGSVFEHCFLNFVTTNCSRVFTHEQVRHRAGTAYSQTSGRYVRNDKLNVVIDPILEPAYDLVEECREYLEQWYQKMEDRLDLNNQTNFDVKKKITSALRRMLPNGQSNELGFSLNLRTLRQVIEMRTSPHAEWEIRLIYNQIYEIVYSKYPAIFADAHLEEFDGLWAITFDNKKI